MEDAGVAKKASVGFLASVSVLLVALVIGFAAGTVMSRIAPSEKFSWTGLAVAPLWMLLEIFLEAVIGTAPFSKFMRVTSVIAVLSGFYVAWFLLRAS